MVNSDSFENEFICYYIKDKKKIKLLDLEVPFPYKDGLTEDPRLDITERFLKEKNFNFNNLNVINLWKEIEDKIQGKYK